MEENVKSKKWYALYTKARWEKKVAEALAKRAVEHYCPLNKVVRKWSDRKKIVWEPLFTSYVFVHISPREHQMVRQINGVVNFVHWLKKPALIQEEEINTIKKVLNEYHHVELVREELNVHDVVRVTQGPLMSHEGNVIEVMQRTVKVLLPSLGYSMVINLDKLHLEKVTTINGARKLVHVHQHVEQ